MTRDPVSLGELEAARERLVGDVATFHAQPDFDLICLPRTMDLRAVRWKCFNLERLKTDDPSKHAQQGTLLESLFR